ncbi:xylulokinase [Methylovirgula sp. 4M-Z18]|uniref:xylulokinase n=1 Tax=Methylovirgula sp. 4M-Z18 TaxID=2293567 RepID=UPI000E2F2EFC|nr:xylulokinase [Methylovirgula sp. 4M-Z18]RFB80145.1 xylulokinase [Methylovirgula sp. 4M-Z18]
MYLGIDLGTSSVKTVLVDDADRIIGSSSVHLTVSRPHPGWSEQDPASWVEGAFGTLDDLARQHSQEMSIVAGIGLSGQMHGATLLDRNDAILRPCMLWNDTRASAECAELERICPSLRSISANAAMPGFTAPKVQWVRRHEPDIFRQIASVLLPKSYVNFALTGDKFEDMSDASGTLWLDVAARDWSDTLLAATGLNRSKVARLVEGSAAAAPLRSDLAARWGMHKPPIVAGGAGDNAASAIGLAAVKPGDAFISLGTSGVIWITTDKLRPNPDSYVHAFCHAVPGSWHQMSVILSAASCLSWWSGVSGIKEASLLAELGEEPWQPSPAIFLPYLSGERTPYNDGTLRGMFANLDPGIDRPAMTRAVLEGVGFALRDCLDAMRADGDQITEASVVGGGSRGRAWIALLAAQLGITLHRVEAGESGAALGAARLARLAVTGAPAASLTGPARLESFAPDTKLSNAMAESRERRPALLPAARTAHG